MNGMQTTIGQVATSLPLSAFVGSRPSGPVILIPPKSRLASRREDNLFSAMQR